MTSDHPGHPYHPIQYSKIRATSHFSLHHQDAEDNLQNKTIFKLLEGQGESEAEAEGGGNGGESSHQGEAENQPGTKKLLLENANKQNSKENERTTHAMSVG